MVECFSHWLKVAASLRLENAKNRDLSHLIVITIDNADLVAVSVYITLGTLVVLKLFTLSHYNMTIHVRRQVPPGVCYSCIVS